MSTSNTLGETVECPFCATEVALEYKGGMSFGAGGVVGCNPTSEGTCPICGAYVSAEARLSAAGALLSVLVIAYEQRVEYDSAEPDFMIVQPHRTASYIIREGVRIP